MAYEVWDTVTRNLLAAYETEEAALAALGQDLAEHGSKYVEELLLGFENARGDSRLIANGEDLVNLVRSSRPEPVAIVNNSVSS